MNNIGAAVAGERSELLSLRTQDKPYKIIETVKELRDELSARRVSGRGKLSVGFVPTMGALHEGHMSLVRRSVSENNVTVVSIFLNPLQFDAADDLDGYPKTLEADIDLCCHAGVDLVFLPSVREMYPEGASTRVEMDGLTDVLCGATRSNHFSGVLTVVAKLFNIVMPDVAYFGEKDAQQLVIIKKMVRDLNMPVRVVGCPTVREADGLAMSSRNVHLSAEGRRAAACIFRALTAGAAAARENVVAAVREVLDAEPLVRVEYVEFLDAETLAPLTANSRTAICAVAVWIEGTRLIDNMMFELGEGERDWILGHAWHETRLAARSSQNDVGVDENGGGMVGENGGGGGA